MSSPEERREPPVPDRQPDEPSSLPGEEGPGELTVDFDEVSPTAHDLGLELPTDRTEAEALLLRELAEARQETGRAVDNLHRVAAEFDNFRRRVERDHGENIERASQRVIESLLPTLDALDAAMAFEPKTPSEERILDGMSSTRAQLLETLARDGLEPIPAAGEPFDPKVHEAVSGAEGGDGELVVTSELRRGYTMGGRLIRPTLVTVDHA